MSRKLTVFGLLASALVLGCSDSVGPELEDLAIDRIAVFAGQLRAVTLGASDESGHVTASSEMMVPQIFFSAAAGSSTLVGDLYLQATGVPVSSMDASQPTADLLANVDAERDAIPGLVLAKSTAGLVAESDPTKYQLWVAPAGPYEVTGRARLKLWSAMKDFAANGQAILEAGLFECDPDGSACTLITQSSVSASPWDDGSGSWVERTVVLGSVTHSVPSGRALAVKVVVNGKSDDDMWLAYGTSDHAAQLTFVANKLALKTYETSFWAVKGEDRSVQIDYDAPGCGTELSRYSYMLVKSLSLCPFMRLTVPRGALNRLPDGTRLARGDSVLISVTVDSTDIVLYLEPSGLQFKKPATLQIWYGGAGGDLNGDGVVDQADTYIQEELLGLWYQAFPGEPWELMSEAEHSLVGEWFRAPLDHFSGFAVAY